MKLLKYKVPTSRTRVHLVQIQALVLILYVVVRSTLLTAEYHSNRLPFDRPKIYERLYKLCTVLLRAALETRGLMEMPWSNIAMLRRPVTVP